MGSKVEVLNVTKEFGELKALNEVTVTFEPGKIHGIVGRNGSGKTVLFKCIIGFMKPDHGQILIDGKPVEAGKAQDIGIIIEDPGFIGTLSAYKNLLLLASIQNKVDSGEIKDVLRKVGLDPENKKAVNKFSLGMRHRLGIAQAIMEKPGLLVLDEPMNGLDREGVVKIRELFKTLNREYGITIILSSHYAEDIAVLCDKVYEMDAGVLKCREE